ncbi:MAG: S41 family peptidase [Ruminococcaceae bacterium]|nr:S41 family peptidase [Oscillospiraceae bacterium]
MSKKRISIPMMLAICAFLIVITFQVTFIAVTNIYRKEIAEMNEDNKTEDWENKLDYITELTEGYFLRDIPLEELNDLLPKAYIDALDDKYTYYMTKEEFEAFTSNSNADLQGIGVNVIYNNEYEAIEVVGVMSGSPALESGVRAGDLIYIVEDQKVAEVGYNTAVDVMLGKAGTVAKFSVMRIDGENVEYIDFAITRGFIVEETVTYRLHGENVGIIRIEEFDKGTPKQFKEAIDELLKMGADRFVFDVRYNPGGTLDSITEILDMLLPEGPIIRTANRFGEESVISSDENEFNYPMAVVVNGSTASAAELFTSALKDYNKAIIVGETTYGKGTMQSVFGLSDGSAVCMTTDRYYPPFSDSYDGIGVVPNIEISLEEEYANVSLYKLPYENDIQLRTAVEAIAD